MTEWQNRIVGYGEERPDDLLANPKNYRIHPAHQQAALSGVLSEVGVVQNILVNKVTNTLIDGHLRVTLAMRAGQPTIPVTYVELTEAEEALVLATFDPISALAVADAALLEDLLRDVSTSDAAVMQMLSEMAEREGIVSFDDAPGLTDPDDVPEPPVDPITKPGDLWTLGRHRLLCGDSTNRADVDRLMNGEKADMVFTDPPYGMNLDTDYTKMAETKIRSKTYNAVAGDDQDFNAAFVIELFSYCPEVFMWGGDWYYTTLPSHGSWIVWDKRSEASDGLTGNHFEMLWSKQRHRRRMIRHLWAGFTARNDDTRRVHPTEKPVAVLMEVINDYSSDNALVVDVFGGSGSTLIACEQTGRQCRMMELDPIYCDVIVQRWENFTGEHATREPALHEAVA